MRSIIFLAFALASLEHPCFAKATQPWLDKTLPVEERLQSFLKQLNATQKYAMVQGDTELDDNGTGVNPCIGHISGIEELGIPSICMGDGPAGVGNSLNNVTTFPAPVVAASSWNESLQYAYGQALAQEHMAKGRNVVLAPTINILRSPLWARAAETFSEDPWLTTRMAVAGTKGIQSQGAVACPKHFAAYNQDTNRFGDGPDWDTVDVYVDERTLHELYLPAFKATVQEAKAGSIIQDWGFDGFVVADWYFSTRSTVAAVMAGLDISMPGGSLMESYGFPEYYGDLLIEAVENGSIPFSRIDDMVARLWRPMFAVGAIDNPLSGDAESVARTQAHLDLAQEMTEEGSVLLKNDDKVLPLSSQNQVSENHGGFVIDSTMIVQSPLDALKRRSTKDNITVSYATTYPGTDQFPTIPSAMFKNRTLSATYYTTTDWSGPVNQTIMVPNITSASYPQELWQAWPQVFSCVYSGIFLPNTTGTYHFSMTGQGDALLYINEELVGNMTKANFGNTVQGIANLKAGEEVSLTLNYSMGYSLSTGAYGVTLGVDGHDSATGLALPGDQDAIISRIAKRSKRTLVILNTNSAILMPWIDDVDAVLQSWYGGQQIGLALERMLFGDISPSGKLPVTYPKSLNDTIGITSDLHVPYSEGLNVGYRWFDQNGIEPLFAFGHGLTYSSFELQEISVDTSGNDTELFVKISTVLLNTGSCEAKEVVQLYVTYPDLAEEPPKLLKAFVKVSLGVGKSQRVILQVKKSDLQIWSAKREEWHFVEGVYEFWVGFSAIDLPIKQAVYLS
ncbi:glycoside hydrolase family 3 domain-containing protein [Corynespora cassiicola Philippines]|uniref:beta-glucosidase n=1 Tax=Corynespora cassiicola Philippines TaxID=1448308 RepID=A0A2T2NBC5_CORCC|nr:glycoside hydrolase family 3 domain-containing protein [Corynespora cassiicola Philippines]